ncbi:hypothetical protein ACJMK2_015979 [Sinanodonta woodiana]|uniref:Dynein heavy chain 3, axonemal n=1 Tax=Sinanodonta woodiana TaxID=1069815 RepID=A0ABD3UVT0_SINWO
MPLRQGQGIIVAQPNEFELLNRPSFISHLPPLSAHQPAYSERPKILERGSFTKAAPIKEKKHFRYVSDSIGNNYSPTARNLTASYIYETTKFSFTGEENYFLTPRPRPTSPPVDTGIQNGFLSYRVPREPLPEIIDLKTSQIGHFKDKSSTGRHLSLPLIKTDQNTQGQGVVNGYTTLPPLNGISVAPSETEATSGISHGFGYRSGTPQTDETPLQNETPQQNITPRQSTISVDDSYDSGLPASGYIQEMTPVPEVIIEDISQNGEELEMELEVGEEPDLYELHDPETRAVLNVVFHPFYYSTHGLSRPSTPSEEDMPRYYQLIDKAIEPSMISPIENETLQGIYRFVPADLRSAIPPATKNFLREMEDDRRFAIKKAVLDYIILDTAEQERLGIMIPPKPSKSAGRLRFPWHETVNQVRDFVKTDLYITHPVMYTILYQFEYKYGKFRLIDIPGLRKVMPITMEKFTEHVQNSSKSGSQKLQHDWLAECCAVVEENQDEIEAWMQQDNPDLRLDKMDHFFASLATLMSNLLRSCVKNSINDLVTMVEEYYKGNKFDGEYNMFEGLALPQKIHLVKFFVTDDMEKEQVVFRPPFPTICDFFYMIIDMMVESVRNLPCIEHLLFQEIEGLEIKYISSVEIKEEIVIEAKERIKTVVIANSHGPNKYVSVYEPYKHLLSYEADEKVKKFISRDRPLREYVKEIERLKKMASDIASFPVYIPMHFFLLDCTEFNQFMVDRARLLVKEMVDKIMTTSEKFNRSICQQYDGIVKKITFQSEQTDQLVTQMKYVESLRAGELMELKDKQEMAAANLSFLMDYAELPSGDILLNNNTFTWSKRILPMITSTELKLQREHDYYVNKLRDWQKKFQQELDAVAKQLKDFQHKERASEADNYVAELKGIQSKIEYFQEEKVKINHEEQLLGMEATTQYNEIQEFSLKKEPFDKLWGTAVNYHAHADKWLNGPLLEVNAEDVAEEVQQLWKTAYKLMKQFNHPDFRGPCKAALQIKGKLEKFKINMPLINALCNPGIKNRHWDMMSEKVGFRLHPTSETPLSEFLQLGLEKYLDSLQEISSQASKEFALEKALEKMKNDWKNMHFSFVPYKDTKLEDHIVKTTTMKGSPFIGPFETEVNQWDHLLAAWLYLEPIFGSEDIRNQIPKEGQMFVEVDNHCIHNILNPFIHNLTNILLHFQSMLDAIQKGLNDYLEMKRLFFPRFFFLSNDELLEILSETKDPLRVQPHLKKCFEGISQLGFTPDKIITSMESAEKEVVQFSRTITPADAKGLVEETMKVSLKEVTMKAIKAYTQTERHNWVTQWPGQVVLAASQVHWTTEVTQNNFLGPYLQKSNKQIDEIVKMVRGQLSKMARITLGALIVIDVHARDVVSNLLKLKIANPMDFSWISQLRYYFENDTVQVRMITTTVQYAYEYLGNTGRLVITPLTDRCYRTLMGALLLNLGGAPEGPAGTGKTETSKDLAKAVAKQCVVFNCSDGLDYKAMGKFFKGLAQSGAWACFDEFNRIELEVLSVIAQQVQTIQRAIAEQLKTFVFEGTEISLDPTCTIFITMNPGYAGRAELPDNLKVLFRTVAMMIPDYAMIAEISLYSMGFVNARSLSTKIVETYRLCSEQLSSQHHYDYGMRAVKSVLTAAGNLKIKYAKQSEDVLVLRSINDVNLPKFLSHDIPLFEGIISDLFPGVVLPKPDYGDLETALVRNIEKQNLQAIPWFIEKIIQIYDMIMVRHGLMIVGDPLGGKSSAFKVLAEALKDLHAENLMEENAVDYIIINPKAVTMGQLYGRFDPVSHEWTDGVLANAFRAHASSTTEDRKWIIFDGPVDAVWIENMNTVLDDNKKLCLMSGEIIQMNNKQNMIFEPMDLEQASPATVSRCGMIYMDPLQLGWQPLVKSWMQTSLPDKLTNEQKETIELMFEWLLPPCLNFVVKYCKHLLTCHPMHLTVSMLRLYSCLLEDVKKIGDEDDDEDIFEEEIVEVEEGITPPPQSVTDQKIIEERTNMIISYFFFSMVWSVGATLDSTSRIKFDEFFRNLCDADGTTAKSNQKPKDLKIARNLLIPKKGLVFDHVYLRRQYGSWNSWSSLVTPVNIDDKARIQTFVCHRRKKGIYGPPVGKKTIVFVDDLNMPAKEKYGAQPPIEVLRQWIDQGYWFDRKDTSILELQDIMMVCAMGPPGGGRNDVTPRFLRHFNIISIESFDDETMKNIFSPMVDWHFRIFEAAQRKYSRIIVSATLEIYQKAVNSFLPTPSRSHYIFNLRDFARVVQGVLLLKPDVLPEGIEGSQKIVRLWVHEVYRVFYDRLVDDNDRETFFQMVKAALETHFKEKMNNLFMHLAKEEQNVTDDNLRSLMFGDCLSKGKDEKLYDEIQNLDELKQHIESCLEEYNQMSKAPMSLVMFRFAIEHISRISRVLKQPNGHCLLVGIGGSGRQSATRLAAFMSDFDLFQIEITKNYTVSEWREDLRTMMRRAGDEGVSMVFLFGDQQIKDESFLEDINMILNTGDIPNLYDNEDRLEIIEKMQIVCQNENTQIERTPLNMYNKFIERIRRNLHVVLAFSPIGEAFRNRIRMFPSLINCCTIDWFMAWPEDALELVAHTFLDDVEMSNEIRENTVVICQHFHQSIRQLSEQYYETMRRVNYVTPTSYLELIKTFKNLLNRKRMEILTLKNRYIVGLEKLEFSESQINIMQKELIELKPKLIQTSKETEELIAVIEKESAEVQEVKKLVEEDEKVANAAAAAAKAIKDECEEKLSIAMPALNAAIAALDTLKQNDITIVKSMQNPPSGVKLVMEAVCIMKQLKPEKKTDPNGKAIEDYWPTAKKMISDMKFLDSLKEYDKDNIPVAVIKKIRERYINNPEFDPAIIKNVSSACEGLCKWIRALDVYDSVAKVVAPKRLSLEQAEGQLATQMAQLHKKQAELQAITDKLNRLTDNLQTKQGEKQNLEDNIELTKVKIERAEKLISGLGGEKERWTQNVEQLSETYDNIVGDVLLSAGVVAYLGPFILSYRQECISDWYRLCKSKEIPLSEHFSLHATLGEPVKIRDWQIAGLPVDNFSIDNAIIVINANRWPLMIDPQGQANKWIKNMEKSNKVAVIKLSDPNYSRTLENCIQFGNPCLLENVGEELDPILEPILLKQTFKQSGLDYIRIGDHVIEYSRDFKFYITTSLRNPHYLPEVSVKVTLLNFMITPLGLEDQLLGIVAAKEKPELEEKKNELILESARNKRQLKEIEDKILEVLSESEGNILEDETAIKILSSSKVLSEEILVKQEVASKTEEEIDLVRDGYQPVAKHSSVLFFTISDLANIDPMYQYSLAWFINLYLQSIINSSRSNMLEQRIENLNHHFTYSIYKNVCRSLFEKDKLLFSFLLCIGIAKAKEGIDDQVWRFLLTGGVALENPFPNPAPAWLNDKSWSEIVRASDLPPFKGFMDHFKQHISEWKKVYDSVTPHLETYPNPWNTKLSGLQTLVVLRCLRPDKMVPAVQNFIVDRMGQKYIEPPTFDLSLSYADSHYFTPLIFVLSPGADPMAGLIRFAEEKGILPRLLSRQTTIASGLGDESPWSADENRRKRPSIFGGEDAISKQERYARSGSKGLQTISLGQGQGPIAEKMIMQAVEGGTWVVLQNCHLAASWLGELERICETVITDSTRTKPEFRLWLTSYPSPVFPVSVLQNGVKMTNEPPKGLRANLLRSYLNDPISDPTFFNSCNKPAMFLNDYDKPPLEALIYLTGECNYGGRVTDNRDRRLIISLLEIFYCEKIIYDGDYKISESSIYYAPPKGEYDDYVAYIRGLPLIPHPEVFGLHENADITKDQQETQQLFDGILLTLPRQTSGGGKSSQEMIEDLAADILSKVPPTLNLEEVQTKFPVRYEESMNTVLIQELIRFNRLIQVIRQSLQDIRKAIKGLIIMSTELEDVFDSMMVGKVPAMWAAKSYPSLKPLGSYITDLLARIQFFKDWIYSGTPTVFWISGFYFTQSFLTGVLQNYARRYKVPIDHLGFEFEVMSHDNSVPSKPNNGAYVRGLYMEGARWCRKKKCIEESYLKILFDQMPVIWLKPGVKSEFEEKETYECPVYKTSARRGNLSTTGHSTNFVLYINLPTDQPQNHWINRGVACLCQLDN